MQSEIATIDFSELDADPVFRADFRYYLLLANTAICSIFWHVFKEKAPRKQMKQTVHDLETAWKEERERADRRKERASRTSPQLDFGLRRSLFTKSGQDNMDAYKADFITVLEALPNVRKDAFANKMRLDHALPLTYRDFVQLVERLMQRRHFLQHYDEKARRGDPRPDDGKVVHDLGLLFPPMVHGLFLGMVQSAQSRNHAVNAAQVEAIRKRLQQAREARKEGARALATERSKRRMTSKAQRVQEEEKKTRWGKMYMDYFPRDHFPRYNPLNFKLRFFFMGEPKIRQIMDELDRVYCPQTPHFRNEIEAVYDASLRVNVRIFEYLDRLSVKQKKWPKQVKVVRNHIAHNGLFWTAPDAARSGERILLTALWTSLFALSEKDQTGKEPAGKAPNGHKKAQILRDQVRNILKSQDYSLAYPLFDPSPDALPGATLPPEQAPPPIVVRHWSAQNRKQYGNADRYRIDKRLRVRHLMRLWQRELDAAWKDWVQKKRAEQKRIREHGT